MTLIPGKLYTSKVSVWLLDDSEQNAPVFIKENTPFLLLLHEEKYKYIVLYQSIVGVIYVNELIEEYKEDNSV